MIAFCGCLLLLPLLAGQAFRLPGAGGYLAGNGKRQRQLGQIRLRALACGGRGETEGSGRAAGEGGAIGRAAMGVSRMATPVQNEGGRQAAASMRKRDYLRKLFHYWRIGN